MPLRLGCHENIKTTTPSRSKEKHYKWYITLFSNVLSNSRFQNYYFISEFSIFRNVQNTNWYSLQTGNSSKELVWSQKNKESDVNDAEWLILCTIVQLWTDISCFVWFYFDLLSIVLQPKLVAYSFVADSFDLQRPPRYYNMCVVFLC